MDQDSTFWLVWNPLRDTPKYRHESLSQAKAEAARLASLNPGEKFIVLEAICAAKKVDVTFSEYAHQMPF